MGEIRPSSRDGQSSQTPRADAQGRPIVLPYPVFPEDSVPRAPRSRPVSPSISNVPATGNQPPSGSDYPAPLRISPKPSSENLKNSQNFPSNPQLGSREFRSNSSPKSRPAIPAQTTGSSQYSTNPYIRAQAAPPAVPVTGAENPEAIWGSDSKSEDPAHQDDIHRLTTKTSQISLSGSLRTSLQEPSHLIGPHETTPAVSLTTASPEETQFPSQASFETSWASQPAKSADITPQHPSGETSAQFDSGSSTQPRRNDSLDWDPGADISTFDALSSRGHGLPSLAEGTETTLTTARTWEEQQAWERDERARREHEAHLASERAQKADQERRAEEEWHRGEEEALRMAQSGATSQAQPIPDLALAQLAFPPVSHDPLPNQAPQQTTAETHRAPPPSNQTPEASTSSGAIRIGTGATVADKSKKKKETYQIKQVNWYDARARDNPRRSPILIQNLNGPCPLLALVNALVLSTPADTQTALVETLRVREQITLGFLLDAVFDELMSGRRGGAAQELPDVSELYAFLSALHTGMNVNPRFIPVVNPQNIMDLEQDQPIVEQAEELGPGTFEHTREMRLYSTFAVPLIHGWLPPKGQRPYDALRRSAATYEDAQNLMFREEELEDKLQAHGLTPEEQVLLEDISTIKYFLTSSATQLTAHGLNSIQSSMKPGGISILFRNDHFSTVYKHPHSGQLLQLITDAGYASHDEIVWESLVDVNGERCEFFSGDFRPVGNIAGDAQPSRSQSHENSAEDNEGWTTVEHRGSQGRSNRTSAQHLTPRESSSTATDAPFSPSTEQEDRDFALALQMQEEEEERERREAAARRREEDLSRTYLSGQSQPTEPPSSRGRRHRDRAQAQSQDIRPMVPPARDNRAVNRASNVNEGTDPPPPTYEQAANGPAYVPPPNHPAHPNSPSNGNEQRPPQPPRPHQRQQSAYSQTASQFVLPTTSQSHPGLSGRGRARERAETARNHAQQLLDEMGPSHHGNRRRQSYAGAASQGQQEGEKCAVM